ncbi:hypothetical protein ACTPOK_02335 [Streptomyces inhibens]|uniref:hypothetical protein n=1 Tax=Streptomyces inhibens TaxID=2293571 RepID=UPI00402A9342
MSDIDLMAAVTGELSPDVLSTLDAGHHRFWSSQPEFADRIDLIHAPAALLSSPHVATSRLPGCCAVRAGAWVGSMPEVMT